jgi:hypothetical protein
VNREKGRGGASADFTAAVASARSSTRGGGSASAGFTAMVASAGLSTRHVAGVEEKRKDGGQCRMSDGERSRDVLGD